MKGHPCLHRDFKAILWNMLSCPRKEGEREEGEAEEEAEGDGHGKRSIDSFSHPNPTAKLNMYENKLKGTIYK